MFGVDSPQGPQGRPTLRFVRRRPTCLALAATVVGIAALGAIPPVAERTAKLRILDAPPASAAALVGKPGAPPERAFDLATSRAVPTPDGPGYVVTSRDRRQLCLVLPDVGAPGTFGSSCHSVATVERRGTLGLMVRARTRGQAGRSLVAFVLPAGADTRVTIESAGQQLPVSVTHGVAVATLEVEGTLRFWVGGRRFERAIPAPFFDSGRGELHCRNGKVVPVQLPVRPANGGAPAIDTARLCR